jgi:phosphate transport system permease protein
VCSSDLEVLQDAEGKIAESTFGIGAMLVGTFIGAFIAIIIGVPIAVLSALYLTFYARGPVKKFLISVIDLMAAFPSLLFGFWAFIVFMASAEYWAKLINKYLGFIPLFDVPAPFFERSPFIAGLVLAIMIIPIVTAISREVFDQTPLDRIQAAYALGASKLAMIRAVVIPYGRGGIIGGAMLGLGRAMGETVAVYTVLNVVYQINWQILFGAGGNVASLILLKFGEAGPKEVDALMAAGLVLFFLTLSVNAISDVLINRFGKKGR